MIVIQKWPFSDPGTLTRYSVVTKYQPNYKKSRVSILAIYGTKRCELRKRKMLLTCLCRV